MKIFNLLKYLKQKRIVKKINKALSISLYDWQIDYIFNGGKYHGECDYGRQNGKTTANILALLLLADGRPVQIDKNSKLFLNGCLYLYAMYGKEDDTSLLRRRFFVNELLKTYHALINVKGLKLRKVELV